SIPDKSLDFLAMNEILTVTYNVQLTDNAGHSVPQQVIVTLTGSNDLPTVDAETLAGAVTENAHTPSETASGTIAFHDVDLTDVHLVSAAFKSTDYSSQLGTLTVVRNSDTTGSGTGGLVTWTFTANDGALAQLAAGQTVHEVYNVTLNDQHGGVITQDVIITINGVNDAPVLAPSNPGLTTITEDQSNNPGQTVASFADPSISDVDNGAVKGIAVTGLTSANGTWQYSINGGSTW